MKKTNSKKSERKNGMKEYIAKLKRENQKLRQENELLRGLVKSGENTQIKGKTNGYSVRYSREVN